ncbi:MAG: glycosyltransferase [Candidatus Sericytochromatia bacterium]
MSRLQVILVLNHLPQQPPWFGVLLQQLRQFSRFQLTVINNGQPYQPKRLFHQLGLTCQLISYPLRFHPAQLLHQQLEEPLKGEALLWLDDQLLWHPAHLPEWLKELRKWPALTPCLLPTQPQRALRQVYQAQASSAPEQPMRLQALEPDYFPPALLLGPEGIPLLRPWLQPDGQLPLPLTVGCDTSSPAWHSGPAASPAQSGLDLDLPTALARWQRLQEGGLSALREQALLESLQRALPDAPAVYARLAPLLPAQEAVDLLRTALERGLIYPELLMRLTQALQACRQETAAEACQTHLRERFPAWNGQRSPWPLSPVSLPVGIKRLPQAARLSVCLIVRDEMRCLERCLSSIQHVAHEVIVVDTGSSDGSAELAAAWGAQVFSHPWTGDFSTARNQALAAASGDWVLMIDADEILSAESIQVLQTWLWDPPPGLPRGLVRILDQDEHGEIQQVFSQVRLFPRNPLFQYQGRIHEELDYTGPGSSPLVPVTGLHILHDGYTPAQLSAKSKHRRNLEILNEMIGESPHEPRWWCYRGDVWLSLKEPARALDDYQQALAHWLGQAPDHLRLRAVLGAARSLQQLQRSDEALTLLLQAERDGRQLPDYWYLRGQSARQQHRYPEAISAFETCLALRGQPEPALGTYTPAWAERAPLLQLMQLYRGLMNHPAEHPRQRQQWVLRLLQTLKALLPFYPEGHWQKGEADLYALLAEGAVWGARLLPERTALSLYREYALIAAPPPDAAWYTETALMLRESALAQLADRLPAGISEDQLRELQLRPYTLHTYAQQLWEQPELDGPALAAALLHVNALVHQDPSLEVLLSHLYRRSGDPQQALRVLRDAQLHFPDHAYLLVELARQQDQNGQHRQALQTLERCLSLQPGLEDALQLRQHILSQQRRLAETASSTSHPQGDF